MNFNSFTLICMFIIIGIIFYKVVQKQPLYEGIDGSITKPVSYEATKNIASVFNTDHIYMSNIDVNRDLNVKGDIGNINGNVIISGPTTAKDITANILNATGGITIPSGKIDVIADGQDRSIPLADGCYLENIKFTNPFNSTTMSSYPDSYALKGYLERGYIQNAFCKRGYYMAGFNQSMSRADTAYRSYQIVCCPFVPPAHK